jgi:hypothetical protein
MRFPQLTTGVLFMPNPTRFFTGRPKLVEVIHCGTSTANLVGRLSLPWSFVGAPAWPTSFMVVSPTTPLSPFAQDDPVSRPPVDQDDNNDGCTNITVLNFFWKWIVCLLQWLFG